MVDVKKIVICFCILNISCAYGNNKTEDINEDVEQEDLDEIDGNAEQEDNTKNSSTDETKDSKSDNTKQENGSNKAVGGWYSGLDVKYVQPKLQVKETNSDSTLNYNAKGNLISPSMTLGYDFLFDKLILGGECNVAFNFGSSMDYNSKTYNQNIAKITKGVNFVGAIKVGVALGSVVVYGKVGGDLSKWKYDWKLDDKTNTEKKYKAGMLYGGGIEKQFMNHFYMRTEFSYSPNITHDSTSKKVKDCKLSDVKTNNYQISIGGGYRF